MGCEFVLFTTFFVELLDRTLLWSVQGGRKGGPSAPVFLHWWKQARFFQTYNEDWVQHQDTKSFKGPIPSWINLLEMEGPKENCCFSRWRVIFYQSCPPFPYFSIASDLPKAVLDIPMLKRPKTRADMILCKYISSIVGTYLKIPKRAQYSLQNSY